MYKSFTAFIANHFPNISSILINIRNRFRIKRIKSLEFLNEPISNKDCFHLDIGCSNIKRNPFGDGKVFGLDINDFPEEDIFKADLVLDKIPFQDNFFDHISAFDLIEHIPRIIYIGRERKEPFIGLMNEIYRVLKPGGIFLSHTPMVPFDDAFSDPTHVNYISTETFKYFCRDKNGFIYSKIYGFNGCFKIANQYKLGNHLVSLLVKD